MKNTVTNPLILSYSNEYKVNKPLDQTGKYVDLEIANELLENEKTNVSTIQHLMLMIKSGRYNEAFFLETLSRMEKDTNTVIKKATE